MTTYEQLVPGKLRFAEPNPPNAPYPDNWLGMADDVEGATKWLQVGGITDAGARRLALRADRTYVSGSLGVGTPAPRARLHVTGNDAVLNLEGADHAYIQWFPDGFASGRKAWTGFGSAGDNTLTIANEIQGAHVVLSPLGGNVGIGTAAPTRARLEVAGKVGATTAAFGQGDIGVSLTANWPGVGFNSYHVGGWKAMAAGYSGVLHLDHGAGAFRLFTGTRAAAPDQPVTMTERLTLDPNGNLTIAGNLGTHGYPPTARNGGWGGGIHTWDIEAEASIWTRNLFVDSVIGLGTMGPAVTGLHIGAGIPGGQAQIRVDNANGQYGLISRWTNRLEILGTDAVDLAVGSVANTRLHVDANQIWLFRSPSIGSDARLKENIAPLRDVLAKLAAIRGVSFERANPDGPAPSAPRPREIGVVAQEVEAVFPELVTTHGEEGYRAVDYGGLTGVLLEAVKNLHAQVGALRRRLAVLEPAQEPVA